MNLGGQNKKLSDKLSDIIKQLKTALICNCSKITGENNRFIPKSTSKLRVLTLVNQWKNDRKMTDKMTGKTGIGNLLISCSNQCSISGSLILFEIMLDRIQL